MAGGKEESSCIIVIVLTTKAMEKDTYIILLLEVFFLVFTDSKKECMVGVLQLYQSIKDARRLFRIWEMGQLFKYMTLFARLWFIVLSISRSWNKKISSQCSLTLGSFTSRRISLLQLNKIENSVCPKFSLKMSNVAMLCDLSWSGYVQQIK